MDFGEWLDLSYDTSVNELVDQNLYDYYAFFAKIVPLIDEYLAEMDPQQTLDRDRMI